VLITPNHVYSFSFISQFDQINGVYKVSSVLSYAETLKLNLDLFALTYKPNSISEETFKTDLDAIRANKVYKLTDINDETIIYYIPEHILSEVPDGNVQKYFHLGLAIDLGVFDDSDQLSVIRTEVDQVIESMLGYPNKTIVYTVDNSWMTPTEYAVIDDARKLAISRVNNHFTDKLALIKQVDSLKTLLKHYENALKAM